MILTMHEHQKYLSASYDRRATADERDHLSYVASLIAAREPVKRADYLRAEALVGGALSTVTPIFDR